MIGRMMPSQRLDLRALPIAVKIALALALILLISGVVTDQLVRQVVRDAQVDAVLGELETISRTQALRLVDKLSQGTATLNALASSNAVRNRLVELEEAPPALASGEVLMQDPQLYQSLLSFRNVYGQFDSVAILDNQGRLIAINPIPEGIEQADPAAWDWYSNAYKEGEGSTYISGPRDDFLTGARGIHIAIPIYSPPGREVEVIGVLYGVWNMSVVIDVIDMGGNREGLILEPEGTVLLSSSLKQGAAVHQDLLSQMLLAPSGSFTFTDNVAEWLYGYVMLSDLGLGNQPIANLRWIVAIRLPSAQTRAAAASLANRLRVAIGISAGLITTLALILVTFTLFPLRRLTDAASRIRQGELDAPIPQLPPDEIGQLAVVLQDMVGKLVKRLSQLNSAVKISQSMVLTLDINQLLSEVARGISEQFGHPSVRIYLADLNAREARLQAAAGRDSIDWLRRGHRIAVDDKSHIGRAILYGEPQFAGTTERVSFIGAKTPPPEVAIGLWAGGHPLGALLVVGQELTIFEQEDVTILTLVADQLSAAIENARLYEQSVANLTEIEELNRRLTRQSWQEYVEESGALRRTRDPDERWPEALEMVRHRSEVRAEAYADADGRSVLAVPLVLRGEPIGTLAVTRPAGETWSKDEIMLVESIASRLTMIAEGIRLVEETTRRAVREQQVNEVSASLLQRVASVDGVLHTALTQLSGALGSDQVSLRIGRPPIDDDHQIAAGSARAAVSDNGGDGGRSPAARSDETTTEDLSGEGGEING